jgi:hypothetical protein
MFAPREKNGYCNFRKFGHNRTDRARPNLVDRNLGNVI